MIREFYNPMPFELKHEVAKFIDFGKKQIMKPMKPYQYMEIISKITICFESYKLEERLAAFKGCNEISFAGYLVKTILSNQDYHSSDS